MKQTMTDKNFEEEATNLGKDNLEGLPTKIKGNRSPLVPASDGNGHANPEKTSEQIPEVDGEVMFRHHQLEGDIREQHRQAGNSSTNLVIAVAKCGLLLRLAKCIIPHGQFEDWFDAGGFGFSKATRSKYMHVVENIIVNCKSKPDLLLNVRVSSQGQLEGYTFNEKELKAAVLEACRGRSLTELYVDWQIATSSTGKRRAAAQQNPQASAGHTCEKIIKLLDHVPGVFGSLSADKQSQLVAKLQSILKALTTHKQQVNGGNL